MPQVGIFWFDLDDHTFFGVRKQELTPKQVEEAADKGYHSNVISIRINRLAPKQ